MEYKQLLNEEQYQAVTTDAKYVRVVAGAGSGKTRVLTYRLAYLVGEQGIDPSTIVAIAFTNKVANEMKARAMRIIGDSSSRISVSTFHSFCARFLRKEIDILGFPTSFTIIDEEDQKQIMKSIAQEFGFKKNDEIVKIAAAYIAKNKCEGKYPDDIVIEKNEEDYIKTCYRFFLRYEEIKNFTYNLDFDDLLLYSIRILEDIPAIREKYASKITNILVDEFQDTNDIQFKLIKLLMNEDTSLYVVGDPDQTIYTWRGANQNLILNFPSVFIPSKTIILDRNYRSTSNILNVANELIEKNAMRVPKNLYTANGDGEEVHFHSSYSKEDEASFVADKIRDIRKKEKDNPDVTIAILYRAAYLTLPFEREFIKRHINYSIYGGVKFFERREVKDVLSFCRLVYNERDDISFERIINVPRRGVGETTFEQLKEYCISQQISIYQYLKNIDLYEDILKPRIVSALKILVAALESLKEKLKGANETNIVDILQGFLKEIGYYDYLAMDDEEGRLENVITLLNDIRDYIKRNPGETLKEYLQNVTLQSAQDEVRDDDNVAMMTVHVAKGLEFDYVFVVGMVEGVFPSEKTMMESARNGLEEERRLCYVAFTRAKKVLYVTTNTSYSFILEGRSTPSRFIGEAGLKLKDKKLNFFDYKKQNSFFNNFFDDGDNDDYEADSPSKNGFEDEKTNGITDWKIGDIVYHAYFGKGEVKEVFDDYLVIDFEKEGRKTMQASHPTLSKEEAKKA